MREFFSDYDNVLNVVILALTLALIACVILGREVYFVFLGLLIAIMARHG